ncbi:hypothetical protein BQ8482_440024 [Mesorhizobium delmotii]|uniref:Uncharacterized protein n=1 Tax=Mesorhizobium delmotii TaxID=1631247 RepID=A0A2P9ATM8_9HYPH|nr:hypothetical protein BQ8482_440024 [Mesorhizobium delmotii]
MGRLRISLLVCPAIWWTIKVSGAVLCHSKETLFASNAHSEHAPPNRRLRTLQSSWRFWPMPTCVRR